MKHLNENNNPESNSFALPENYFQKSTQFILNKMEWLEEHKNLPTLIKIKSKNHFKIPENHFNISETKLENIPFPFLNSINKINSFDVPPEYFEEVEINEFYKTIKLESNENLSSLNAIKKENKFKVDATYFTEKENKLFSTLTKINNETKLIQFNFSKAIYAVAAILILVLGLWMYSQLTSKLEVKDCGTLACIDKIELRSSKQLENFDTEDLYEVVNSKTLEQNLEHSSSKKNSDSAKNNFKEDLLDEL